MTSTSPVSCSRSAGVEVGEDQSGLRIDQEIAERVEEQIAGEIRNGQHAIAAERTKPGLAAAMGHIDLPLAILALDIGGDEEGVRALG